MPRVQRPWFRVYVEMVWDRKLRSLPAEDRWVWIAVLAIARASCLPGVLMISERQPVTVKDIADAACVAPAKARRAMVAFEQLGLVEADPHLGAWFVVAWDERQFESDKVTDRTRLHRSKENGWNVPTSFPGTSLEPRQSQSQKKRSNPPKSPPTIGVA